MHTNYASCWAHPESGRNGVYWCPGEGLLRAGRSQPHRHKSPKAYEFTLKVHHAEQITMRMLVDALTKLAEQRGLSTRTWNECRGMQPLRTPPILRCAAATWRIIRLFRG